MRRSFDSGHLVCRSCLFGQQLFRVGRDSWKGEEFNNSDHVYNHGCGLCNRFPSH